MERFNNAPDFVAIANTLTDYRRSLIDYITSYQEYAEEIGLCSVNLTDYSTPVISGDDSFNDEDMYTLDCIERDIEGNIVACGSSASDNFCEIKLVHLPFDTLCEIAQLLKEYNVSIIGNLLNDATDE
jgi:hypothetical protein